MKTVRVKFLKSHPNYGYFAGDNGEIGADAASVLTKQGYLVPVSADDDGGNNNPLPEDMPARDLLFEAGFTDLEKVIEAGDSLIDIKGVGKGTVKQILEYLAEAGKSE